MSPLPTTGNTVPRRIAKGEVKYLAFEGGGGAGNAYPGALKALENLRILKYHANQQIGVWGIAGSSAGAITALFLSMGYTPDEMEAILAGQDFNEFFDPIIAGFVPRIGGCVTAYTHVDLATRVEEVRKQVSSSVLARVISPALPLLLRRFREFLDLVAVVDRSVNANLAVAMTLLLGALDRPSEAVISEQLTQAWGDNQFLPALLFDYGLFSGQAIRNFFAAGIAGAVRRVRGLRGDATTMTWGSDTVKLGEINFEQHHQIFGGTLVVTGSNLETGKTELFSWRTTPKFPVADAVRISMSIPIAYKPLVLKDPKVLAQVAPIDTVAGRQPYGPAYKRWVEGVWVDGGVFNNTPVGVFDQLAGSQEHTVALRLRFDTHTPINNFVDFYAAYPLGMAAGTGESQISGTLSPLIDRTIELPVTPDEMGLFTFSPSPDVYEKVNKRSYTTVMEWFE